MSHRPDRSFPRRLWAAAAALIAAVGLFGAAGEAQAVPAYAIQTGQPCNACHVGGFGPQLTAFGRDFKVHGYTARAVGQFGALPVSMMTVASYLRTQRAQDAPPAPHTSTNDNLIIDQTSLFIAGGVGEHFGGFVQTTWDGPGRAFAWDNLDLRATTLTTVGASSAVLGLSLNNNPGVQDPWNTLPAWGYPYTGSGLAPGPAAAVMMDGGLAQSVLGVTASALWDSSIYAEAGGYWTPDRPLLSTLGVDPAGTSQIRGVAPYVRLAWQHSVAGGDFEVGGFGLFTRLYPGWDRSTGQSDRYDDLGLDASYQRTIGDGNTLSLNGRYTHERQTLAATEALGGADNLHNTLNDVRADASYYLADRIGGTLSGFRTWGTPDAALYPDSRTESPNSSGVSMQVDGTLFGAGQSPLGPRFNARIGVQYTMYSQFNGASKDYDGLGHNASDNNTLRVFTWFAY